MTASATRPSIPRERILGIDFFAGSLEQACALTDEGGLILAPSGPGLGDDLVREPAYRAALKAADLVLTDSGYLVLLWALRAGRRLPRHSGYRFLRTYLLRSTMPGRSFWVMPGERERDEYLGWLRSQGLEVAEDDCYVAPRYGGGEIADQQLRIRLEQRRPATVFIAIGGGVQERLGHYLQGVLPWRPGIVCIGAAIAFLSGSQVRIPMWADRVMLGWLFRLLSGPRRYAPRYLRAAKLAWLILRYGRNMPVGAE